MALSLTSDAVELILICFQTTKAGEKRAQEESGELLGVKDKGVPNAYTQELLAEMASWEPGFVERDGYLLYLSVTPLHSARLTFVADSR